jgi:hypothetical protein
MQMEILSTALRVVMERVHGVHRASKVLVVVLEPVAVVVLEPVAVVDLAVVDLAVVDLAVVDLAVVDLAVVDLVEILRTVDLS